MTDWVGWHHGYDDPASSLSRRLAVVRELVGLALRASPPRRVLSLCAGDGRDLLPVLADAAAQPAAVTLVELDPRLAEAARARADGLGLASVDVRCADAGDTGGCSDVLPVDLLLLCGIFGNVGTADIERTVAALPGMLRRGGHVLWTRGNQTPDLREHVRGLVRAAGCTELRYEGPPEAYGVGLARLDHPATQPDPLPGRLFTFTR